MQEALQPLHVVAATLLIQLLLLIILALGLWIYARGERRVDDPEPTRQVSMFHLALLLLGVALFSFAVILATEDFYGVWRQLFPGVDFPTLSARAALSIVFLTDLVVTGIFMSVTGGGKHSPFVAVILMIPALAIFLRESAAWFLGYALISALVFLALLRLPQRSADAELNPFYTVAFGFVTLSCLALSMFIGYITRPVPLDQITVRPTAPATVPLSQPPVSPKDAAEKNVH